MPTRTSSSVFRLRKHADYQRVYKASRKQFSRQMSYFFMLRSLDDATPATPRVGLTVGKVMGKAVDRNRIKRRMREAVRRNLPALSLPVDVVLHPKRSVIDLDFAVLEREIAQVFLSIQKSAEEIARKQQEKSAARASMPSATVQ
ncbi:MAG TPA: ribonuclease P protein component [Edaphobacter sp.]